MKKKDLKFFDRDLSWLSFNERVLQQAARKDVPLLEKIRFLAIYSSNLDEFYRVRMPVLQALKKISNKELYEAEVDSEILKAASCTILTQQQQFGQILTEEILPGLLNRNIHFIYNGVFPEAFSTQARAYFLTQVLGFLKPVNITKKTSFFPANNALYFLIQLNNGKKNRSVILNIPSDALPRFFKISIKNEYIICFLDDIIRNNLDAVFDGEEIISCSSFKVTREAEIDLKDEYPGELSDQIEAQLLKRDAGFATRFLYQPGIRPEVLKKIRKLFNLKKNNLIEGGRYHNLKDLSTFPVQEADLSCLPWPKLNSVKALDVPLADIIDRQDVIIHTPYQSYDPVLRFFNEAAVDPAVEEIYITLYRVASDSKIANALISAAQNGKKIYVLVELKARFDEANNIRWTKKMKDAGVFIFHSLTALKIHAKIALAKRKNGKRNKYTGLLATGNFNETTAAFYTDHILMTANKDMLREIELLFLFLAKRKMPEQADAIPFEHLLVAKFNLQERFIGLINKAIKTAKDGKKASIVIKLNNLEEQVFISKLYEASNAGVQISLIIRGICSLVPGVAGLSENIRIIRIVDRYLEHGRVFIFDNNGEKEVYMGSADWMNRNIYRRIEVCFPIYDPVIKEEILRLIDLQLADNVQAVLLDQHLHNQPVPVTNPAIQSQHEIYKLLEAKELE